MNPSLELITQSPEPMPVGGAAEPLRRRRSKPTPYAIKVGLWLRRRRVGMGITQREAARRGRCSNAWICQLETAQADVWSTSLRGCRALCEAYAIDMRTLLRLLRVITPD